MSIADKLVTIAENEQRVYEAGKKAEYDRFWDNYQNNGNRTSYAYAFGGRGWAKSGLLPPKYPMVLSAGTTTQRGMFNFFNHGTYNMYDMTEICEMLDCSQATNLTNMFEGASATNITLDISNCAVGTNMFDNSTTGVLGNIRLKVTEKLTTATNMFRYCNSSTILFTEDSVINVALSFAQASSLSTESVDSIVNALKDLTGTTAKKITFHTDVVAKLTENQLSQIMAKNWRLG